MTDFLLALYWEQLPNNESDKGKKDISWVSILDAMERKYAGASFNREKLRNKFNAMKKEFFAYRQVRHALACDEEVNEAFWEALISTNPLCAKFKSDEEPMFPHYDRMLAIVSSDPEAAERAAASHAADSIAPETEAMGGDEDSGLSVLDVRETAVSGSSSVDASHITEDTSQEELSTGPAQPNALSSSVQEQMHSSPSNSSSGNTTINNRESHKESLVAYKDLMRMLMRSSSTEGSANGNAQDRAMKFFDDGGICAHFMLNRQKRNKIYLYFGIESNASTFLRVPDRYKGEFVTDFILSK
jgi:hypothetical protein